MNYDKRSIRVTPVKAGPFNNCVKVDANVGGRTTRWTVCSIGRIGEAAALSISRRGRAGGARSYSKSPGGMVACSASGERSKCVTAPYGAVVFPGGASKLKRKGVQFAGAKRRKGRR